MLNGASYSTSTSLADTGTLSVGGAVTINGNLTESGTPTLNFAVSGLPGSAGAPDLTVTGSTQLAGALTAEYTGGFGSNGDAYTAATFSSAKAGAFSSAQNGYQYRAVFTNSQGSVTSSAATLTVVYATIITPTTLETINGVRGYYALAQGGPYLAAIGQVSSNRGVTFTNLPAADVTITRPTANEIAIFVPLTNIPAGDTYRPQFEASPTPI